MLLTLPLRLLIGQREPALRGHISASSSRVHLTLFSSLHGEGLILKHQLVNGDSFEPKAKNKKQSPARAQTGPKWNRVTLVLFSLRHIKGLYEKKESALSNPIICQSTDSSQWHAHRCNCSQMLLVVLASCCLWIQSPSCCHRCVLVSVCLCLFVCLCVSDFIPQIKHWV